MAENDIRVYVIRHKDRANLIMRYRDPFTGKHVDRSAGTANQKQAEKAAAIWEDELRNGRYVKPSRIGWEDFRERFEDDGMVGIKGTTAANYASTFNAFEELTGIKYLADLTTARVTEFARELRKPYKIAYGRGKSRTTREAQRSEATVARHLRHLKAVARWAYRQGYLLKLPAFDMPKKASGATRMKGRPITTEEFERMLTVAHRVVGKKTAESWKLLLRGLWTSGLRISEAMALRWDSKPGCPQVILAGHKSVLAFDADSQKSGKVQLVPMAPEFVQLLEPLQRTSGYVFTPILDGRPIRDSLVASKTISTIGRKANVVVDAERGKYASAHDLRRAFGYRWAKRPGVSISDLKDLMRHSDIKTTLTYYVGQDAKGTSERLWEVCGKLCGTTEGESQKTLENQYTPQESNL